MYDRDTSIAEIVPLTPGKPAANRTVDEERPRGSKRKRRDHARHRRPGSSFETHKPIEDPEGASVLQALLEERENGR